MIKLSGKLVQLPSAILLLAALTACGGSSSSATPTTVPSSATIFYAHNLVFLNNTTLSTGYNGFGQLGTGNLATRNTLGPLATYYPFKGFATGGNHSVAFTNNSTVYSWGYNAFGQLGNNSTVHSEVPVVTANIRSVKAVAAGAYHTLALKNDDTLWAWGYNAFGQLGVDTSLTQSVGYSPLPLRVNAGGVIFSNISSVAANAHHSLARANGLVWAWGFNGTGQLAIDPKTTGALASPAVVAGLPPDGINGIAAGGSSNYALARNGTVWAWGNNDNGQLGNNSTVASPIPVQVLKAPGVPLTGVVQIAAGLQHGLALLSNGEVWAWGYNGFYQLGNSRDPNSIDSDNTVQLDSSVAVQVVADASGIPFTGVTEIRAFGSSSMAKKAGGAWFVWGNNTLGQLGIGSNGRAPWPKKIPGF